jgi:hypothetical protein
VVLRPADPDAPLTWRLSRGRFRLEHPPIPLVRRLRVARRQPAHRWLPILAGRTWA